MDKKYYIRLHKVSFEVSKEDYLEYHKIKRRIKYIKEAEKKLNVFSYNCLDTDGMSGEDIIVDTRVNVEEEACNNIMLDKLRFCLAKLNDDELYLIEQLIYEEKTERELSKKLGISQVAVNKRKNKIIEKLKNILNN